MRGRSLGLTLVEVLVGAAILGLLGVILAHLYDVSSGAYATGAGRVALQQRARQVVQRVAAHLVQAVPPTGAQDALYSPDRLPPMTSKVVYTVPSEPFDPRAPAYRERWISFEQSTGLVTADAETPGEADQVLARDISWLGLEVIPPASLKVTVVVQAPVRTAGGGTRDQEFRLQTVVQIPYYSTR